MEITTALLRSDREARGFPQGRSAVPNVRDATEEFRENWRWPRELTEALARQNGVRGEGHYRKRSQCPVPPLFPFIGHCSGVAPQACSSVDVEGLSGDESGGLRREKRDGRRHLRGAAQASDGDLRDIARLARAARLIVRSEQLRFGWSRRDGVRGDPLCCQFDGHASSHAFERGLRRSVTSAKRETAGH